MFISAFVLVLFLPWKFFIHLLIQQIFIDYQLYAK